jgi:hypothetical protein
MRWSRYHVRAEGITHPELRGFFLHHSALGEHQGSWDWECPWCDHSVLFGPRDRALAEDLARGHILSRHGVKLWNDVAGALQLLRSSREKS